MFKHSKKFPWLSVIIPAHNCSDTIERLLDSIVLQNDDDIEVIICDDNSTDGFMDKVEPYKEKLNIKYFKTKPREVHCPGNTRMDGWHQAIGEWITFIDHDDVFEPEAFSTVKNEIEKTGEQRLIYCPFRDFLPEINQYGQVFDGITWMHGKWYNRYWLIQENIDFKENLYTHEDLYFNSLVLSNIVGNNSRYTKIEGFYPYKWIYKKDSMSRQFETKEHSFIETYLKDYVYSTMIPWTEAYHRWPHMRDYYFGEECVILMYVYFYYQGFVYSKGEDILKDNIDVMKDCIRTICKEFNVDKKEIINTMYQDPDYYNKIKKEAFVGNCKFIETTSLRDFINSL